MTGIFSGGKKYLFLILILVFNINIVKAASQPLPAEAGQVVIVSGNFQAVNTHHQTRDLMRGSRFYSGEILSTDVNSTAQVNFSDGTIMAFYPNSQIKVDDYRYQENPRTDKNIISLIKGGFRTLTGLISKTNANNYEAKTPVAIIGVRGTNYGAIFTEGKLYVGVASGNVTVKNSQASLNLGKGEKYNFAEVNAENSAPAGLSKMPEKFSGQCGINE